ncbi:hypothetical protein PHYPSEUDO_010819 [Phytophthora pseudosyringae]|uniref:Kinesin-like protein n=1 Tax=Phytophthora pseudosyringae TaxID=221518 RepID=A0A8T1W7J8_9STRA|nr:hypothetical protein PHYPSEUDO_010819 [Phytophthora pseudosyringae]
MESRSSLRQLHQQLGDFSLPDHTGRAGIGNGSRTHGLSWHLPDKRAAPPLPSLPPWAASSNQSTLSSGDSREESMEKEQGQLTRGPPPGGWRKPRSYFMAMKQLPSKSPDADENQQDQENDVPGSDAPHQAMENQQAETESEERDDCNPSQSASVKQLANLRVDSRSSIDPTSEATLNEEEDEPTSSGSGSETNQQEDNRSPIRGQFFRSWKKSSSTQDDDSSDSGRWSPPPSNKWKERAIMDPFAKRRAAGRFKSAQPPPRALSPPDRKSEPPPPDQVRGLPGVHSPPNRPSELVRVKSPARPAVSTSPRPRAPEHAPLNPLRLSSADKRRAAALHRPVTPLSAPSPPPPLPIHSARAQISLRDVSRGSLACPGERQTEPEDNQEPVGFAALHRPRQFKAPSESRNATKQPKKSTMDALNEIKRKREARRALQAKEKRRVEKELREHGDDAGYKFRRLIQQYRDALPPSQQQQQQLQQLPPLSLSASIRPPPTPTLLVDAAEAPRLSVFIRKRPLAKKELKAKGYDIISCLFASEDQQGTQSDTNAMALRRELVCHEPKLRVDCSETLENHQFRFDGVFDEWQENSKVYDATVGPMVPYLVSEATASGDTTSLTVFAYGQTGSGKTYTMKSIYRQAALDLFQQLDELKEASGRRSTRVSVGVSFYEIYMNSVNDLLNGRSRVQLMEDGDGAVQLPGLKELSATNADELLELVQLGEQARATSANAVHDDSSRSHALLRVTLYADNGPALARLSMVDLAGSERASDTQSDKKSTRMEGAEINKSLLALKECVRALDRGATHIPFRQSKLTQLLRDSFLSQNSKTIMIATVSPWSESCNHTLNTLRYADRLKEIGAAS